MLFIVGMPGSGKSTVAKILRRRGFRYLEMSDVIKESMRKKGLEVTLANIQKYTAMMKKRHGKGVWARMHAANIKNYKGNVVISGCRNPEEIETFRELVRAPVRIMAITAPSRLRYKRLSTRKGVRPVDYKDFMATDTNLVNSEIRGMMRSADVVISNVGTSAQLRSNVGKALLALGAASRPRAAGN